MKLDKVWYHGTRTPDINAFWPLSHFGDFNAAKMVCANKKYKDGHDGNPLIIEVEIDLDKKDVLHTPDAGSPSPIAIANQIVTANVDYKISAAVVADIKSLHEKLIDLKKENKSNRAYERTALSSTLIKHGFKAISYKNEVENDDDEISLCILDPSIIKIIKVIPMCEVEAKTLWDKSKRNM